MGIKLGNILLQENLHLQERSFALRVRCPNPLRVEYKNATYGGANFVLIELKMYSKKKPNKPNPVPWPFPVWKDGKMVLKKPTKKDKLEQVPDAPF